MTGLRFKIDLRNNFVFISKLRRKNGLNMGFLHFFCEKEFLQNGKELLLVDGIKITDKNMKKIKIIYIWMFI
jgi:hypothetical protein